MSRDWINKLINHLIVQTVVISLPMKLYQVKKYSIVNKVSDWVLI